MDFIFLLGRALFVAIFVASAIGHFAAKDQMVGYAKSLGAPNPETMVPVTGAVLIAGALMVLLGLWADVGALLLIGFLAGITPIMHAYWSRPTPQERQQQQIHFNKNLSLLGGAIVIFWLYAEAEDLPLSLTNSVF